MCICVYVCAQSCLTLVTPWTIPWWLREESVKNPPAMQEITCSAGDPGLTPELGRSPRKGNGNPLQYLGLENPMDRGAWRAIFHRVSRVQHDWGTGQQKQTAACQAPLVCGIFQVRVLERVAISSCRGSSRPRDQTCLSCLSCIGKQIFYQDTTWKTPYSTLWSI